MPKTNVYRHPTCTGNSKYGNGSEHAVILDKDFMRVFVYIPRSQGERFLMSEQLLAKDRPQRGG